jgi:CheY-like chemotaxis protein
MQQLCGVESQSTPTVSKHTRILIADDDLDDLELLELAVDRDADVYTATNGGELFELVAESAPFDVIVTDLDMPWIPGLQALASIRDAGLGTPVLVVTGLDRPRLHDTIARLGNAMLLRKPFEIAALRRALVALLAGAT